MLLKSPLKGKRRRLGDKYDIDDIKDLTGISSATINDEIDVGLIFPKLTEGARQKVGSSVSTLKALGVFYCPVCREKVDEAEDMTDGGGRESLMCSSCMEWIHLYDCSGERRMPKSKSLFFLQKCMNPFQARFGHCDSLFNGDFSDILCGQAYCIRPRGVLFE